MKALPYLCAVVGEPTNRIPRLHASTIARIKAYGIAIHIPVAMWAMSGYMIASQLFRLPNQAAATISIACASMIYLVERLVLSAPKTWAINVVRIVIGIAVALLGASTVDLIIFEREVNDQLMATYRAELEARYSAELDQQLRAVNETKADWNTAVAAAACEANGTCGSRQISVGPIYRELAYQAETRRKDYLASVAALDSLKAVKAERLASLEADPHALSRAGLLIRLEALHEYVRQNRTAFAAWSIFFLLITLFETMVIIMKLVFGETVDDHIEKVREAVHAHQASTYLAAATSPLAAARLSINDAFGQ